MQTNYVLPSPLLWSRYCKLLTNDLSDNMKNTRVKPDASLAQDLCRLCMKGKKKTDTHFVDSVECSPRVRIREHRLYSGEIACSLQAVMRNIIEQNTCKSSIFWDVVTPCSPLN
jgi:hypothetical protein